MYIICMYAHVCIQNIYFLSSRVNKALLVLQSQFGQFLGICAGIGKTRRVNLSLTK